MLMEHPQHVGTSPDFFFLLPFGPGPSALAFAFAVNFWAGVPLVDAFAGFFPCLNVPLILIQTVCTERTIQLQTSNGTVDYLVTLRSTMIVLHNGFALRTQSLPPHGLSILTYVYTDCRKCGQVRINNNKQLVSRHMSAQLM